MTIREWWRIAIILSVGVPLGIWALAPDDEIPDVVRARSFQLLDENGGLRAELHLGDTDGSGNFRLYDAKGRIRVKLGTSVDGSTGLLLLNDDIEPAVEVFVSEAEGVRVVLIDSEGRMSRSPPSGARGGSSSRGRR